MVYGDTVAQAQAAVERHEAAQDRIVQLLSQMLDQLGTSPVTIAVTNDEVSPGAEVEFPVPGTARQTIKRTVTGGIVAAPAAPAVATVLPSNNRRLGGQVVNKGAVGVTLFCTTAGESVAEGANGQIWLSPGGGAWDFRLGNLLWCGEISVLSDGGASTLAVAEV